MFRVKSILSISVALGSLFVSMASQSAVQLDTTRVIVNAPRNTAVVTVKNASPDPYVIQNWIEGPDGEMETPIFVTPPLSRIEGSSNFSLSIRKIKDGLPEDKESYFWLNVMEIPKTDKAEENLLTLAIRTRIKVFYRPEGLGRPGAKIAEQLGWFIDNKNGNCEIKIKNPTPFIMNFSSISIDDQAQEFGRGYMSMPMSEQIEELAECPQKGMLNANIINDYGALVALPAIHLY